MSSVILAFTAFGLMVVMVCLAVFAYVNQYYYLDERRQRREAELKSERAEADVRAANTRVGNVEKLLEAANARIADVEQQLAAARQRNLALRKENEQRYLDRERRRWFGRVQKKTFRSKADVGAYLLYPMLRFLGYSDDAFEVDYPVTLVGGPRGQPVLVSCYLCTVVDANTIAPRLLLEAVPPDEGVTDTTREQVKWKAFSAGVPKFGMTDGSCFELFTLAAPNQPVVQCRISELPANWDTIEAHLGASVP